MLAGIIDMGVAWLLIPAHGAVGACIGSGVAEVTAIGLMLATSIYLYRVKLAWDLIAKITFISTLAALTAHYISMLLPPLLGILLGGSASLIVFFGLLYVMRVLKPEDRSRLNTLTGVLPGRFSGPVNKVLGWLVRPAFADAVPAALKD
jgi:O-antigen/teichoic acid export membrane protein